MEGVVSGIAGYGNSIGVPTVGGEVYFDDCYAVNPLVNVFCLGLADKDKIFYAKAEGVGNPVLYVGAKTGRDGIHGATMASAEFGKETEHKRPNVQVGDPFKEKLLLEACLEVMDRGTHRRHPGHGRRRPDLLDDRDGGQGRHGHRRSTSTSSPSAKTG